MTKRTTPAQEAELLRAAVREAHEALRDLRVEIKEARALARGEIRDQIRTEVERAVRELGEVTGQAMRRSVDKVQGEFDKLADILMGRDPSSRKEGRRPLDELVRQMVGQQPGSPELVE